jgi:oligopeptide/dipeptide ABC transporter ATP-binding protein
MTGNRIDPPSRLLQVKNLQTQFSNRGAVVRAVDGVSFHIDRGETVGMVGESGCGKSVTALSIMRLIESPGKICGGETFFQGADLLLLSEKEMRGIRGNKIAMIFQEPMTSLNPLFTVGHQITEAITRHQGISRAKALHRSIEMLQGVGIPSPETRVRDYPHQFSGGMRQRVMMAMALCCNPELLIADEPTTALDVTIQAQIIDLMVRLKNEVGMSILMITHDLGVVSEVADRVLVMYAGKIVESASIDSLLDSPAHPYTEGLLSCVPKFADVQRRLHTIPGVVPGPADLPAGCRFRPRCRRAFNRCGAEEPPLLPIGDQHLARCWLNLEGKR